MYLLYNHKLLKEKRFLPFDINKVKKSRLYTELLIICQTVDAQFSKW
jgi:hypothetical protein